MKREYGAARRSVPQKVKTVAAPATVGDEPSSISRPLGLPGKAGRPAKTREPGDLPSIIVTQPAGGKTGGTDLRCGGVNAGRAAGDVRPWVICIRRPLLSISAIRPHHARGASGCSLASSAKTRTDGDNRDARNTKTSRTPLQDDPAGGPAAGIHAGIRARAGRDDTRHATLLPETVVTATRTETPSRQIGSAITVVTGEELQRRQIQYVADGLRQVPGVSVNRTSGFGSSTDIRIRGAEANQTLVLIDGVKVNDPALSSQFDFGNLLTSDIDRIEVLRGPQSVLYGSDAVGGVINIITKRGEAAPKVTRQRGIRLLQHLPVGQHAFGRRQALRLLARRRLSAVGRHLRRGLGQRQYGKGRHRQQDDPGPVRHPADRRRRAEFRRPLAARQGRYGCVHDDRRGRQLLHRQDRAVRPGAGEVLLLRQALGAHLHGLPVRQQARQRRRLLRRLQHGRPSGARCSTRPISASARRSWPRPRIPSASASTTNAKTCRPTAISRRSTETWIRPRSTGSTSSACGTGCFLTGGGRHDSNDLLRGRHHLPPDRRAAVPGDRAASCTPAAARRSRTRPSSSYSASPRPSAATRTSSRKNPTDTTSASSRRCSTASWSATSPIFTTASRI